MTQPSGNSPGHSEPPSPAPGDAAGAGESSRATIESLRSEGALCREQLAQVREELVRSHELYETTRRKLSELEARPIEVSGERASAAPARRETNAKPGFRFSMWLGALLGGPRRQRYANIRKAIDTGYFDAQWYQERYPDVAAAGLDPLQHFLRYGVRERRDPSPRFDTSWYLSTYEDIAESGINPLLHFIEFGIFEGRQPNGANQRLHYSLANLETQNRMLNELRVQRQSELNERDTEIRRQRDLLERRQVELGERGAELKKQQALLLRRQVELEQRGADIQRQQELLETRQAQLLQRDTEITRLRNSLQQLESKHEQLAERLSESTSRLEAAEERAQAADQAEKQRLLREVDLQDLRKRYKELMQAQESRQELLSMLRDKLQFATDCLDAMNKGEAGTVDRPPRTAPSARPARNTHKSKRSGGKDR